MKSTNVGHPKSAILLALGLVFQLSACQYQPETGSKEPEGKQMASVKLEVWTDRTAKELERDSMEVGSTFLSIYSQVHDRYKEQGRSLMATASIHNPNRRDTIYLDRADYFETHGKLVRTYFDRTIYIRPMETVQIVIDGLDLEGGTGANFIFDWIKAPKAHEPIMEAVMITPYGQPYISFSTQGKRLN